MTPHRTELLNILSRIEQAETVATQLLTLDAGSEVDSLVEVLGKAIEDMRTTVNGLLGK
jgi:hypothetical protein